MTGFRVLIVLLTFCLFAPTVRAQKKAGGGGFDYITKPYATGEERQAQRDLWMFELQFKTMRMIEMELTDPKTREKKKELIYYLVYRAINREIESRTDDTDTVPVNPFDNEFIPDLFVPEITLVSTDNGIRKPVDDSVIPEALALIRRRERLPLVHSVNAVQKIPAATTTDEEDPASFYGVAMFRGVDPATDYFTLFMSGFSNGYKIVKGPVKYDDLKQMASNKEMHVNDQVWNGRPESEWRAAAQVGDLFDDDELPPPDAGTSQWFYTVSPERADDDVTIWRKTLIQKYWRPGDRFDQNEREIRVQGTSKWIYRPDPGMPAEEESVETASASG